MKKRSDIQRFFLCGLCFFFFSIASIIFFAIGWRKTGFVDPMEVLLPIIGISGTVISYLWVKLLVRMRKRGVS